MNADPFWQGVSLFNGGHYFEAHEIWEEVWREVEGPSRPFFQGLIQVAVALHHLERGNLVGFDRLMARGFSKLERFQPGFHGINVSDLLQKLSEIWPKMVGEPARESFPGSNFPAIDIQITFTSENEIAE